MNKSKPLCCIRSFQVIVSSMLFHIRSAYSQSHRASAGPDLSTVLPILTNTASFSRSLASKMLAAIIVEESWEWDQDIGRFLTTSSATSPGCPKKCVESKEIWGCYLDWVVLLKLIIQVEGHSDAESIINSKKDLYHNYPTPKCPYPYKKEWWLLLHLWFSH